MDIKKLAPWNWFKDEERSEGREVPVASVPRRDYSPVAQFHQEIDRMFDAMFQNFGFPSTALRSGAFNLGRNVELRPNVDIAASEKEYTITVEVAGVDEKDINLELVNNSLIIRGEKKQEKESKEKDYYRVERAYGSFQRVLSLPEDADQENINARFNNGVLSISLPRREVAKKSGKVIEIKKAA